MEIRAFGVLKLPKQNEKDGCSSEGSTNSSLTVDCFSINGVRHSRSTVASSPWFLSSDSPIRDPQAVFFFFLLKQRGNSVIGLNYFINIKFSLIVKFNLDLDIIFLPQFCQKRIQLFIIIKQGFSIVRV